MQEFTVQRHSTMSYMIQFCIVSKLSTISKVEQYLNNQHAL